MEVKVGQFARIDENIIFEITKQITVEFIKHDIINNTNEVKVADTPQELIQNGDLVRDNNGYYIYKESRHRLFKNYIIEIWTRTDNETFTCQWRAE